MEHHSDELNKNKNPPPTSQCEEAGGVSILPSSSRCSQAAGQQLIFIPVRGNTKNKTFFPFADQQICLLLPPPLWSWWERAFPWNEEGGTVAAITVITSKTPFLSFGLGVVTLQSPGKPYTGEQQQQSELPVQRHHLGLKGDGDGALKLHCVSPRTQRSFKERGLITLKYPKWSRIQKCCNQNKPHRFWLFQSKPKFSFCSKVCCLKKSTEDRHTKQSKCHFQIRSFMWP